MDKSIESIIPGSSPDPDNDVERYIKAAWALGSLAVTLGILTYAVSTVGYAFKQANPTPLDYTRNVAFLTACLNIGFWIWFPLEDLRVLRTWIRTRKATFAAHTNEFLAMIFATLLLILLIVSSSISAFLFGVVRTAIYVANLLGFAAIRRQVSRAVNEAKVNYSKETLADKRRYLLNALGIIERHWSCSSKDGTLRNAQQIRHSLLAIAFFVVALLGFAGRETANVQYKMYAYILGALTILAAEVSIAIWRNSRDKSLQEIFEELRVLHSSTPTGT